MTIEQLEQQYIERDGHIFTPRYTYQEICLEDEEMDFDYTITSTAQEVYNEWLEQKGKPQEPQKTVEEQLEEERKRVICLEAAMAELAKQVAENTLLK